MMWRYDLLVGVILFSCGGLFVALVFHFGLITPCEAELPRNQYCAYTAIPSDSNKESKQ